MHTSLPHYGTLAGTIVYEGVLDSRPVAVKRLLRQFYTLARKEIQVLVVSDEHPNVVRCFAMEEDREFVYLALERCKHSLSDTLSSREGQQDMQVGHAEQQQQQLLQHLEVQVFHQRTLSHACTWTEGYV
jgi:serine/threonine protein kinase